MNIEEVNRVLVDIVEKKMELGRLSYSAEEYDGLEEELHELEDYLIEQYGNYLENILNEIHTRYCPETDVLSPIAYLANNYVRTGMQEDNTPIYDVANYQQGVVVDSEVYALARMAIIPNPIRILLIASKEKVKEVVWTSEEKAL